MRDISARIDDLYIFERPNINFSQLSVSIWREGRQRKKPTGFAQLKLHTARCTIHTVHCIDCTLHTAHYTLKIVHCTLHTVHCTLYTVSVHCTLDTVHCGGDSNVSSTAFGKPKLIILHSPASQLTRHPHSGVYATL